MAFAHRVFRSRCMAAVWGVILVSAGWGDFGSQATAQLRSLSPANRWLESEMREFHRLIKQLRQDERRARQDQARLNSARDRAVRYLNGDVGARYISGFRAMVLLMEKSPEQASLMRMGVSPQAASDFTPDRGFAFAGGTIGELVHFMAQRSVAPRAGTQAQAILAELSHDWLYEIDRQLLAASRAIDRYKAQNASHNAAVKELLIAHGHPGYQFYNDGHYCHAHCHCGARPSQFNFPQGEQPAGLQSQAYAPATPSDEELAEQRPRTNRQRLQQLAEGSLSVDVIEGVTLNHTAQGISTVPRD